MSDRPATESAPDKNRRRQFTLRGLLLVTAVVAGALAVAVQLPPVILVVLVVVFVSCTAKFATSDRRPLVAAVSWTIFGGFFVAYAGELVREVSHLTKPPPLFWVIVAFMGGCGLTCFYRAGKSLMLWRRSRQTETSTGDAGDVQ